MAGEPRGSRSLKEAYEEQYEAAKRGGKPFFPDVIWHDALVSLIVVAAIFVLAALFPATSAGPADPTRTVYSPRPEWYFVFFQQWLRLFPGKLEPLGATVIPLIAIVLIFVLPFLSRGLDRTFARRKGIVAAGAAAVAAGIVLEVTGLLFPPTLAVSTAAAPGAGAGWALAAEGGRTAYANSCASCHGARGEGVMAPALIGPKAGLAKYGTAAGLLTYISTKMPAGSPGSLPRQNYVDILAYLLVENGDVPGDAAFDASRLDSIPLK